MIIISLHLMINIVYTKFEKLRNIYSNGQTTLKLYMYMS
jgi:hypothetical protein